MIVGIHGIKRSGSTVMFNLARIALQQAGWDVTIEGHNYEPYPTGDNEAVICKRHPFKENIAVAADFILLTDRDDEGIVDSLTRFNGIAPEDGCIEDMRRHLNKWREHPHLMLPFYLLKKDPVLYTGLIINYLGLKVSAVDVWDEFQEIKFPVSGKDPETLFFSNHITSK